MTISGVGSTTQATSTATQASAGLAKNFDNFLSLLTAQLKNQDPLQPLDSKEFTQQLVQFTGVEQSINTNKTLEQMLGLFRNSSSIGAVSYIGKTIEAEGNTSSFAGGKAGWGYELPRAAAKTVVTVTDMQGRAVFQASGETSKGAHTFVWNGRNSAGQTVPEGLYQLSVAAVDSLGNPVSAAIRLNGTVTGVETIGDEQMLLVGEAKVRIGDVRTVRQTTAD